MRIAFRRFFWAGAAAMVAALLAVFSSAANAQTLRWASQGDALTLDPHSQNEGLTNSMNGQVYEKLVKRNRQLGIEPGLASSWQQISPLVWRFKLPAGVKEVRAWTVLRGATAPQAAGVIHSDFERYFIRAEVIAYDDFLAGKGEAGAKEAGKLRLEGKEYLVREGDVMHFRVNA